jgi:predicted AAA+ superfamily ATPase
MQIVLGPRQVGKTTMVRQALASLKQPSIMISADDLGVIGNVWLMEHWAQARAKATASRACVLVVDEIQKLPNWSELVKRLWDEDTASGTNVVVVLTGSSTLLLRKGLSESLAGRFEVLRAPHWSWTEMHEAFGIGLNEFLVVGGYPGPMALRKDSERWFAYMRESIIESTLSLDVLQLERIDKPALLRNVFMLGTSLSAKIVSLQKLLGQLQDAGNAATIAHYLDLLRDAGLLCGLQKYAGTHVRKRSASPKLQSTAPALFSAVHGGPSIPRLRDKQFYAQAVESAIGSHLLAITASTSAEVLYWREGDNEVDFVLATPTHRVLIEVKSGDVRDAYSGAAAFRSHHGDAPLIVVGSPEHPVESVLQYSLADIF